MENDPVKVAKAINAPTDGACGIIYWHPPLRPGFIVHELHYSNGSPIIAFRIVNTVTGQVLSKVPQEQNSIADGDAVEAEFQTLLAAGRAMCLDVLPAIHAAIPDLDPGRVDIVRGLMLGGGPMIADLVGGGVQNLRPEPQPPTFCLDENGDLGVDLMPLGDAHQRLAASAIAALHNVRITIKTTTKKG